MAFDFLQSAPRQSLLSLLGSVMCFAGIGTLGVWSNINVYVFSYYYIYNKDLSLKLFNIVLSMTALLAALISLVAMKIAEAVGFKTLIRFTMITYPLAIIISSYTQNVWVFSFFFSIVLGICAGLGIIPLLYCIFKHFGEKNTGHVTGIQMGFFGLSQVVFIILTTLVINPKNLDASVIYTQGLQTTHIFSEEVAENVPYGLFYMGILCFCLMVPGSFIIEQKQIKTNENINIYDTIEKANSVQNQNNLNKQNLNNNDNDSNISITNVSQGIEAELLIQKDIIKQIELINVVQNSNYSINNSSPLSLNTQNVAITVKDEPSVSQFQENAVSSFSVKKYIKKRSFQLLFFTSMNVSLQIFFLSLNFKIYGNQKINDDYYLMTTLIVSQIIAAISKFIWGSMVSLYPFKKVLMFSLFFGGAFTMTFPLISDRKIPFLIWYTVITICERGFLTVGPPILIQLYGIEDGTKLIPAYQTAFLLGLITVPVFQIFLLMFLTFDQIFFFSGLLVILTNIFIHKIKDKKAESEKENKVKI